jgi:hypothetical protein
MNIEGITWSNPEAVQEVAQRQYQVGVEYTTRATTNKHREAIVSTIRDTVALEGMERDEAQNLLTAIMTACEMDEAYLTRYFTVEVTYEGNILGEVCEVEADDEEDACEKVKGEIYFHDVTLSVTFEAFGQSGTGEVPISDYILEDSLEYSATEEN